LNFYRLSCRASKVVFFIGHHHSHDDYEKTIYDIEKCLFAFNCQLKKLNGEFFVFHRTTGSPEINYIGIFGIKLEKQIETRFFLPGIHQKYSSSYKCVDNRDIRINKHKHLFFPADFRKKNCGPIEIRTYQKITLLFISGEPDVKSTWQNFSTELF
jgi:hypothetical protein